MANIDKLVHAVSDFKGSLNGQTISIHGKDYATVALRIGILRRNLGSALDIITKIISIDKETVVMQADIYIDGIHISTGHAEEKRNASKINQTSALENCETSCVGRSLAFCGMISDGIASAEEVSAAIEQQDKKVQKALSDLNTVKSSAAYQKWLTDHTALLGDLKSKNPPAYEAFKGRFTLIKKTLTDKGVLQ